MSFVAGDVVSLTPTARAVCVEPEKYVRGVITDDGGNWNVYGVKWNGIDHPIHMLANEIMKVKEEK